MVEVIAHGINEDEGLLSFLEVLAKKNGKKKLPDQKLYIHMEDEVFIDRDEDDEIVGVNDKFKTLLEKKIYTLEDLISWEDEQYIEFDWVNIEYEEASMYEDTTVFTITSDNDILMYKILTLLACIINSRDSFSATLTGRKKYNEDVYDSAGFYIDGDSIAYVDAIRLTDEKL